MQSPPEFLLVANLSLTMADSENLNLNIAKSSEYDREQRRLRLEEQKALQEGEVQRQTIAELQEQLAIMAEHKEDLLGQMAKGRPFGPKQRPYGQT